MEFLRDEDIDEVESLTTDNKTIILGLQVGDPAVELETPEVWPDHHGGNNKETSGKRLRWLHVIGENRKSFSAVQIRD